MECLSGPLRRRCLATTAGEIGAARPGLATRRGLTAALRVSVLGLAVVLASGLPAVHAQDRSGESQLKAAFLFNFIRFVDWPPALGPLNPLVVCVLGPDAVADAFAALDGRRIRNVTLAFSHLSVTDATSECRVVFVEGGAGSAPNDLLRTTGGRPVLTVGESTDFLPEGGIIAFAKDGNKIQFEVNLEASARAGITIRSDLLRLASRVRPAGPDALAGQEK
jgi:hypothetical protein